MFILEKHENGNDYLKSAPESNEYFGPIIWGAYGFPNVGIIYGEEEYGTDLMILYDGFVFNAHTFENKMEDLYVDSHTNAPFIFWMNKHPEVFFAVAYDMSKHYEYLDDYKMGD